MNYMVLHQCVRHPILVVAPLSTISFWSREVERFTSLHPVVYRGGPEARKLIRQWEWSWPAATHLDELDPVRQQEGVDVKLLHPSLAVRGAGPNGGAAAVQRRHYKFNVLITSYEFVVMDSALLSRVPFAALIIDEAQRLKNNSSLLFEKLSQQFNIPRKLLLTGTPIQNNVSKHTRIRFVAALGAHYSPR